MLQPKKKVFGSALLIMGTMIGVGMFGVPVAQGDSGLFPSLIVLAVCWLYTICCARLLLEACTWMPRGANFITIARHLIGKKGAVLCWILYAFFFYSGMTAHISAAGDAIGELSSQALSDTLSSILYTALFGFFVYSSIRASDHFNRVLSAGLWLTFILFTVTTLQYVKKELLVSFYWPDIVPAIPIFLFAFSFQFIIPPLYNYLDGNASALKKAIWIGSSMTLFLYVIWLYIVLGMIPRENLNEALASGDSTIHSLKAAIRDPLIASIAHEFSIFAVSTSFLGVSVSFFDFWADSLQWNKKGSQGLILLALVFLIPLVFAMTYRGAFIAALDFAGDFGSAVLLGVFPALFVWIGRYKKYPRLTPQLVPGGRYGLLLVILISLAVFAIQFIPVSKGEKPKQIFVKG